MINLSGIDIDTVARQLLLPVFNGTRFFVDSEPMNVDEFSTDACPLRAKGFFRGDLFYLHWTVDCPTLAKAHINLQETCTVHAALEHWKQELSGKWFTVRTDNVTTVSVINKGTCTSCNPQVMEWLCKAFGSQRHTIFS